MTTTNMLLINNDNKNNIMFLYGKFKRRVNKIHLQLNNKKEADLITINDAF